MVPRLLLVCLFLAACYIKESADDDGGRPPDGRPTSTCTCDVDRSCTSGCLCDADCGMRAIGDACRCGPSESYCSDTNCATNYCLYDDGREGYCSKTCGSCPSGFECTNVFGSGDWCVKIPTVPNCGSCTDSTDCQPFFEPPNVYIKAACFNGRCRLRCTPGSGACDCVAGTPAGGNAQGYCRDDGC
jgi:hypothetical protein